MKNQDKDPVSFIAYRLKINIAISMLWVKYWVYRLDIFFFQYFYSEIFVEIFLNRKQDLFHCKT